MERTQHGRLQSFSCFLFHLEIFFLFIVLQQPVKSSHFFLVHFHEMFLPLLFFFLCSPWYSLNKSTRLSLLCRTLFAFALFTSQCGVALLPDDDPCPSIDVTESREELEFASKRSPTTAPALFEQTATSCTDVIPKISFSSSK